MTNTVRTLDMAARLRQTWPTLTVDQRQVILDLVWTLAGPESALMVEIEELEDGIAYDAAGALQISAPVAS